MSDAHIWLYRVYYDLDTIFIECKRMKYRVYYDKIHTIVQKEKGTFIANIERGIIAIMRD